MSLWHATNLANFFIRLLNNILGSHLLRGIRVAGEIVYIRRSQIQRPGFCSQKGSEIEGSMVIDLMAAPEATGIFTRERLERMNFESAEIAYKHLGVEAMRCGFTIATNQSTRSNYMTIHCGKGGRVRGNDTKKTGCPFIVYLTPGEDGRAVIRHLRSSAIFIHI